MRSDKKTYSNRLMFEDLDKKTGLHDEIVMWLLSKKDDVDFLKESLDFYPEKITKIDCNIEVPLYKIKHGYAGYKDKTLIGFLDVVFGVLYEWKIEGRTHEGFSRFAIEVKSKVKSIGELVREINYYKSFNEHKEQFAELIVCAPDFPQSHILSDENIKFIPYEPSETLEDLLS